MNIKSYQSKKHLLFDNLKRISFLEQLANADDTKARVFQKVEDNALIIQNASAFWNNLQTQQTPNPLAHVPDEVPPFEEHSDLQGHELFILCWVEIWEMAGDG